MFRNQYDVDVSIFSPQGRLHQLEYAMEAVKLGSATIGLKNDSTVVILAFNKVISELASCQKKIIPIDKHIGISFSGLTADAKILSRFLRLESLSHRLYHGTPLPITRLTSRLGNKMQLSTQRYDRRPYGVGMIIAGYDEMGPHIFQICPSSNFFECRAMAIGSRSQSARTYLEKNMHLFSECSLDELIRHGVGALRSTLPGEVELTTKNVSIAVVGVDQDFVMYSETQINFCLCYAGNVSRNDNESSVATDCKRKNSDDSVNQAKDK